MSAAKERQKALAREYRKQPKKIGAYCIRNTSSQKCFVGISRDLDARLNRHRFALRSNSETLSDDLQEDWNASGADMFEFVVLDTIEPLDDPDYDPGEDLLVLEELWFEQLQPFTPHGYNKQRKPKPSL